MHRFSQLRLSIPVINMDNWGSTLILVSLIVNSYADILPLPNPINGVTFGKMETYIHTAVGVSHMEEDRFIPGNILFSDGFSLKTTNGDATKIVAGKVGGNLNYTEGIGEEAAFGLITGFIQLNQHTVIVVDKDNHCLRLIDRTSQKTSPFIGKCTVPGKTDGDTPTFNLPFSVLPDKDFPQTLYISDSGNNAIRSFDLVTRTTATILQNGLNSPRGMSYSFNGNSLLVANDHYIASFKPSDKTISYITKNTQETGHKDGNLKDASFTIPYDSLALQGDIILVADSGTSSIRLIDLKGQTVFTICTGAPGLVDDEVDKCQLQWTYGFLLKQDTLYIAQFGAIRSMKVQYPMLPDGSFGPCEVTVKVDPSKLEGNIKDKLMTNGPHKARLERDNHTICIEAEESVQGSTRPGESFDYRWIIVIVLILLLVGLVVVLVFMGIKLRGLKSQKDHLNVVPVIQYKSTASNQQRNLPIASQELQSPEYITADEKYEEVYEHMPPSPPMNRAPGYKNEDQRAETRPYVNLPAERTESYVSMSKDAP